MFFALKIVVSAVVLSFAAWLADKKPILAGFIIALPLVTMLSLALNYVEFKDPQKTILFAKSVMVAVPLSLSFFIPFLFSERLPLPFWALYGLGVSCLVIAYFIHQMLLAKF